IQLTSSDISKVQVPDTVILPAGSTQAVFTATIQDNALADGTQIATISAAAPDFFAEPGRIVIHDNEVNRLTVSLSPGRAREGDGVLTTAGQVRLLASLQTNLTVTLISSDETELMVPPAITIPAGEFTAAFDLTIADDAEPDGAQTVTVTASAPSHASDSA